MECLIIGQDCQVFDLLAASLHPVVSLIDTSARIYFMVLVLTLQS